MKFKKYINEDVKQNFSDFKKKVMPILKNMEKEIEYIDSLHDSMFSEIDTYTKEYDKYNFDKEIRSLDANVYDLLNHMKRVK